MRSALLILVTIISTYCKADFIDKVDIYVNGKYITSTDQFKNGPYLLSVSLNVGDTVIFHTQAHWDELFDASIEILNSKGEKACHLKRIPNNKYGAQFIFVIKEEYLIEDLDVWLHYNVKSAIDPWHFGTIKSSSC